MEAFRNKAEHLNDGQKEVLNMVINAVRDENTDMRLFFLNGPGGTDHLSDSSIRRKNRSGGSFKRNYGNSTKGRKNSALYFSTRVGSHVVVYVQRNGTLQPGMITPSSITDCDLMKYDKPFGGKVVLLAGDFRQIRPVTPMDHPAK
ncbi:Helitron helicase [Phytophthora megakarya]|uniref:ATP-dependent DNA helicase n=1 Tax=Phytophthora megakarya TaxID=4795 RepID=A0A225VBV7_9STRA|nr:Helitron helicase [Phytophthora megakarya]